MILGEIIESSGGAKVAGLLDAPIMSITMKNGLVDQSEKFKKRIASADISGYKKVMRGELVVGFPIDEGVLGFQTKYDYAAVSPAYDVWKLKGTEFSTNFLEMLLRSDHARAVYLSMMRGSVSRRRSIAKSDFLRVEIPLPPLAVQQELVAEIEGYQKIIDGARQVVENYKPRIDVRPEWPVVELGEVCKINPDSTYPPEVYANEIINYIDIASVENETGHFIGATKIPSAKAPSRARRKVVSGDVLLSTVRPNLKAFTLLQDVPERTVASTGFAVLRAMAKLVEPGYLVAAVRDQNSIDQMVRMMGKGAYPSINTTDVKGITIPLPDLETQRAIVAEIEAEQRLVAAAKELVGRFEAKIKAVIGRVWGDGKVGEEGEKAPGPNSGGAEL